MPGSAPPGGSGLFGCALPCWAGGAGRGLHSSGGAAGASLAVLRGRGSLSVFVLLLLHLLHDFPDLALRRLGEGEKRGYSRTERNSTAAFNARPSMEVIL